MSRVYNTLTYDGTEKAFADWGIKSAEREASNQAGDSFAFDLDAAYADAEAWPYGAEITVRIQRTQTGAGWSGGMIHFIGYRVEELTNASPDMQSKHYKFTSAWDYFFNLLTFQQLYGGAGTGAAPEYRSQVVLGQAATGQRQTIGDQMSEIVNYVSAQILAEYGEQKVQVAVDALDFYTPFDAISNITCGEAIMKMVRWLGSGMCSVWMDYTTTPPTLRIVPRNQLPAVALSAPTGVQIKRRDDLTPTAVHLQYKSPITIDGETFNKISHDVAADDGYVDADGNVQGATLDALKNEGRKFGSVLQTFDFEGWSSSRASTTITTAALNVLDLDWWRKKCPELKSVVTLAIAADVNGQIASIAPAQNGETLLGLSRELRTQGSWLPWMNQVGQIQEVEVKAKFSGTVNTPDGRLISLWLAEEKHVKIKVTNLVSGTYYSPPNITYGEPLPFGLAKRVWDIMEAPQYQGTITIDEEMISNVIGIGNVANFTSGRAEWQTMAAQVQQVAYSYDNGKTTVSFGPAKHLGAVDFIEQLRCNRGLRLVNVLGLNRANDPTQQPGVQMPSDAPTENSTGGIGANSVIGVVESHDVRISGNETKLFQALFDGPNKRLIMSGAPWVKESNPGTPQIVINHTYITNPPALAASVVAADGSTAGDEYRKRNVALREMVVLADATGKLKKSYVLASEPVDAGLGTISGGGLQCFKTVEILGDYLRCRAWDGVNQGSVDVLVAKQYNARQSHIHQFVDGILYQFAFTNVNQRVETVVGSSTTNTQIDVLTERYYVDGSYGEDIIWAATVPWSGVTVGDVPLTLLEVLPHRIWARKAVQA